MKKYCPAICLATCGTLLTLSACGSTENAYDWQLPEGFPRPVVPASNPMSAEKVELGRHLFYEERLSGNETQSCGSCHEQALGFADGIALPTGSTGEQVPRNSMGLANVAYNSTLTWASPLLTNLEDQVLIPMFGEFPIELGITGSEDEVLARLSGDPEYQELFRNAFGDDEPTFDRVAKAISSFVRTMISSDSAFDRHSRGDSGALTEGARRGMTLFFSERLECHHCHGGFNFSLTSVHENSTFVETAFHNTGLYNIGGTGDYPINNTGLFEFTGDQDDMGRFRPPSLRNVAVTAPYMHDGSIATLEDVLEFYARGGRLIDDGPFAGDGRDSPYKSGFVTGFTLSAQERADLLEFLNALTDETFLTNPALANPFQ